MTGKEFSKILLIPSADPELFWEETMYLDYFLRRLRIGSVDNAWDGINLKGFDVAYIPGGNTFDILRRLKENGVFQQLQEFAQEHVLMGASAGSIIMTPTIRIAQFADTNDDEYDDLTGLNLVPFEVKPHWGGWKYKMQVFRDYIQLHHAQLYGIPDDGAIVVNGDEVTFHGEVEEITLEKKVKPTHFTCDCCGQETDIRAEYQKCGMLLCEECYFDPDFSAVLERNGKK
jgi:hypothetical protein